MTTKPSMITQPSTITQPSMTGRHTARNSSAAVERSTHRGGGRGGVVAVVSLALCLVASSPVAGQSGGVSLALGTQAPDAELETLDGDAVSLLDHVEDGKPALIEFWASWCEQCEALQPQLDRIQERYGDRMSVVAVAVGVAQSPRRIRRHLEDHDPGYPYLYDARGNAVRAYNAATTSIIVMLDREGKVAYTGVGTEQDVVGAVERLMEG